MVPLARLGLHVEKGHTDDPTQGATTIGATDEVIWWGQRKTKRRKKITENKFRKI